jgi:hypothetical protein
MLAASVTTEGAETQKNAKANGSMAICSNFEKG